MREWSGGITSWEDAATAQTLEAKQEGGNGEAKLQLLLPLTLQSSTKH